MRGFTIAAGALAALTVVAGVGAPPSAHASDFGVELNGTYRVTMNGEFALTNDVYIDEPTVVETWHLSSNCESPIDCEGEVRSDAGWTERLWLGYPNSYWVVDRFLPNWVPCPNGTVADGTQRFQFWGINPARLERDMKIKDLLVGRQRALGPSGACGVNKPVAIETPLKLELLS